MVRRKGQIVTIYYNDQINRVSKLVGELIHNDRTAYTLKVGGKTIIIPFSRIVRVEEAE